MKKRTLAQNLQAVEANHAGESIFPPYLADKQSVAAISRREWVATAV
jgi:hypothetical protein